MALTASSTATEPTVALSDTTGSSGSTISGVSSSSGVVTTADIPDTTTVAPAIGTPNTATAITSPFFSPTVSNGDNPGSPAPQRTTATIIPPPSQPSTSAAAAKPSGAPKVPKNFTVPADASSIQTVGAWTIVNSTCNPDSTSKKTSIAGQTLKFSFVGKPDLSARARLYD